VSRLKRIRKRVDNNRLQKRRVALPPREQLIKEAHILKQAFPHDAKVRAITDAFLSVDDMLFGDGQTARHGGGEKTKPVPPHETMRGLWKKPPPEWGNEK
jgi:hypothetical protein